MKFGDIKRIYLFGGGGTLLGFAGELQSRGYEVFVFTSPRHGREILSSGKSLVHELDKAKIRRHEPDDINTDKAFLDNITKNTLGIGFGEVWTFTKKTIDLFDCRLLDFMGIPLPQYRGGAHYTWQILQKNRIGACNLQIINEFMVQGQFDSGKVIYSKQYLFPASARIPQDYFKAAHKEEIAFLAGFLDNIKNNRDFAPQPVPEQFSMYFPRLNTIKQGWIDWSWGTNDIATFINAFDDPYPGASTKLDERVVRIKNVRTENTDGPFHPFCAGLVYRINNTGIYVASKNGTIIIGRVADENNAELTNMVGVGQRFFTPVKCLEDAMCFCAQYDAHGEKS